MAGRAGGRFLTRRIAPWLVLIAGVTSTVGAYAWRESAVARQDRTRVESETGAAIEQLTSTMRGYEAVLRGQADPQVFPGLKGFESASLMPGGRWELREPRLMNPAVADALARAESGTVTVSERFPLPRGDTRPGPTLALVLRDGNTANVAFVDLVTFLAEGSGQSGTRYRIEMFEGGTAESDAFIASAHIEGQSLGQARVLPLEVHGEVWTIRFTDRRPTDVSTTSLALLAGGLVGTALLFALVFVVSRSELRARRMVREATEELSRQEQHFRALVANSSDLVTVIDAEGRLRYISPAVTRLLAYEEEDLLGVDVLSLVHPDDIEAVTDALNAMFTAPRTNGPPLVLRVRHAHGGWRHLESNASNLLDNPAMQGIVVNSRDVTERVAFQEHLETQATHDALTGLPNRTLLLDRLSDALERATDTSQAAVLFVDLDRFKLVNDSLGHGAGDRLLVLVAERLRHAVRPGDVVARFGGDEFVVLAEGVVDAAECSQIADRLAEKLAAPFRIEGQEVFVTASVGMTLADPSIDTADTLLRDADAAMYRAKDGGRARSVLFEEQVHQRTVERLEQEAALHRALERDELVVLYQPQLDIASGEIVGVETFLGWQHPDRGLLGPGEFLRVAEDTGLIVPFGAYALVQACADGARWMEQFGRPLRVSVNVSARQLLDAELHRLVLDTLSESGLPADALCLEVSESVLTDTRDVAAALHAVHDLGVRIAIDDFGTGYAALAHLKRFPVDQLKIDSTFVSGLGANPDDTVIVAAVIGLAHALGVVAVAEGVENDTQLDELRALRCDVAQGYLFAHPGDAAAIELLLGTPV